MCVPTSSRVSRAVDQEARVETAFGLGQPVADLLEAAGQARIVEGESDVILDHAESLPRPIGGGIEDPRQVGAAAGLGQVQRRNPLGEGERSRVVQHRLGEAYLQRPEVQAGRAQQVRGRIGGGNQAGQQMLGTRLPIAIDPAHLAQRLAEDQPQGRRLGNRPTPRRGRSRIEGERLVARDDFHRLQAQRGPDPGGLNAELRHQLRGPTLGLESQRRQQIQRFDQLRLATTRHRFGPLQGALCACSQRFEHQDDDSMIVSQTGRSTDSPRHIGLSPIRLVLQFSGRETIIKCNMTETFVSRVRVRSVPDFRGHPTRLGRRNRIFPPHLPPVQGTHTVFDRSLVMTSFAALTAVLALASAAIVSAKDDPKKPASVLDFHVKDIDGKDVDLAKYQGKALLIVNTASQCGYTPQYKDLEALYEKYKDQGFEVLAFPANEFGSQEPGDNAQIKEFCSTKYKVSFPLFSKIVVDGQNIHPLYQFLTSDSTNPKFAGKIGWNFTKFLVNRKGEIIERFQPGDSPSSEKVAGAVEKALAEK